MVRAEETANPVRFNAFVEKVLAFDAKATTNKRRRVCDSRTASVEQQWMPFKLAEDREGYDVVVAQLTAGTLVSRPHPNLPESSGIKWPYNLQVRCSTERDNKAQGTESVDKEEVQTAEPETLEAFDAKFAHFELQLGPRSDCSGLASTASLASTPQGSPRSGQPGPSTINEGDRTCVAHIRKAHNAWDRARREYEGAITTSSLNENTKGCKFEADLLAICQEGAILDNDIVGLEQKFLCGVKFSREEIDESAERTKQIKALVTIHISCNDIHCDSLAFTPENPWG